MKKNWLFNCILKYKKKFMIAIGFIILDGIATFLFPGYISKIIDIAVPYKDTRYLLENVVGLLLVSLLSIFSNLNINYLFYNVSNNFVFDIKKKIILGAFHYNGVKIQKNASKFATCIIEDVYMIEIIASQLLASTLLDVVTLGVIVFIMIKINVSVLIFILFAYPFLLFVQFMLSRKIKDASRDLMEMRDKSNALIMELVEFLYQYIAFNGKEYFENRFFPVEEQVKDKKIEICMLKTYNSFIPQFVNTIAFALIVGYCAYKIITGHVSLGELTIIIMYIRQLSSSFIRIIMAISEFQKIGISIMRIDEIVSSGD